jgi:hypothetical protein
MVRDERYCVGRTQSGDSEMVSARQKESGAVQNAMMKEVPAVEPDCGWGGTAAVVASFRAHSAVHLMVDRLLDQSAYLKMQEVTKIAADKLVDRTVHHMCVSAGVPVTSAERVAERSVFAAGVWCYAMEVLAHWPSYVSVLRFLCH